MDLDLDQRRQLVDDGYLVIHGVMSRPELDRLNAHLEALWEMEGDQAGRENTYLEPNVRRLANLADKGDLFRPIFNRPLVLQAARCVLGPTIHLGMLNAREVLPEPGNARQPFHCDTDRNQHGGKPDPSGYLTCTAIWLLTESTAENGATRVIPGSHRSGKLPEEILGNLQAPHPDERILTGAAGDVCVVNGHCWHCGGANQTSARRRALLAHYLRADIYRDPHRRQHLSAEVKARMSVEELQLLDVQS